MREVSWGHDPAPARSDGGRSIGLQKPSSSAAGNPAAPQAPRDGDNGAAPPLPKPGDRSPRKYGPVDQVTLEAVAVATLLRGKNDEKLAQTMRTEREKEAEALAASGITGEYFEDSFYGAAFDAIREVYLRDRQLVGINDLGVLGTAGGQDANQVEMYKDELHTCYATLLVRQIRASVIVKQMRRRHRSRKAERIFLKYQKERKDPKVGSEKALERFRQSVATDLADPDEAPVVMHDWMEDYGNLMSRLSDMKRNPEKYMGYKCGIKHIDDQTKGFRPGHLTVFVGAHGGFKSTMMLNVAFGLWRRGYNVLYASLEMEAELMEIKLWCRATKQVKFSRLYGGMMSETGDWDELQRIRARLESGDLGEDEAETLGLKKNTLETVLAHLDPNNKGSREDATLIREFYEERKSAKNRLKIMNAGQSTKVKPSQIARCLKDCENDFRPDVVVVDYLSLVAPETAYPDRRDQELGDICKYFRQLGKQRNFAVVTAAQFKRAAIERIRNAEGALDKIQIGTDDIADSNQIGADADEVFMLLREDGGQRLRVLTAKSRHGQMDVDRGVTLQVKPDLCLIDSEDVIEDTSVRGSRVNVQEGMESLAKARMIMDKPATPDDEEFPCAGDQCASSGSDLVDDLIDERVRPKATPPDEEDDF